MAGLIPPYITTLFTPPRLPIEQCYSADRKIEVPSLRQIECSFPAARLANINAALADADCGQIDILEAHGERCLMRATLETDLSQNLIDKLQSALTGSNEWQIAVLPVEARLPMAEKPKVEPEKGPSAEEKKQAKKTALREEIYQDVSQGATLNQDFIVLTILSAIVAAVGMGTNSVAVVIGAMVIAPLLGPILAFAFSAALGDPELMFKASKTAVIGMGVGFLTALVLGQVMNLDLGAGEMMARTILGPDVVILALASGAAAALSLAAGSSSALVGVMVAVALLPPSAATALFFGGGEYALAARAATLLTLNVISVNIGAMMVFALKGIRPRTWLAQKSAKRSQMINITVWSTLLIGVVMLLFNLNVF